jgi:hypothetical protein
MPVRVLDSEDLPGGRKRITIDTVTMGRAQVIVAPGEHPQTAIDAMLSIVEQRVADGRAILHNGQS